MLGSLGPLEASWNENRCGAVQEPSWSRGEAGVGVARMVAICLVLRSMPLPQRTNLSFAIMS